MKKIVWLSMCFVLFLSMLTVTPIRSQEEPQNSDWITVKSNCVEMSIKNKTTPLGQELLIIMVAPMGGSFPDSQVFDVYLYDSNYSLFSYWSRNKVFLQVLTDVRPGYNSTLRWNLYRYDGAQYYPPPPGNYYLVGAIMGWGSGPADVTPPILLKIDNSTVTPVGEVLFPAPDLCIEGILLPYLYAYAIYPNPPLLGGYKIKVNVTNQGTADADSFSVSFSVYWEGQEVPELWREQTITGLQQGVTKTVWFDFMPENYGNYTLMIMADCNNDVAELDETNNKKITYVQGTIRGDMDGDGDVDKFDLGLFAMVYGRKFKEPPYDPADFDYDGDVDKYDLGTFALNYGKTL